MNISIIGAGNVGKALASSFARVGHDVTITAKHPERARQAADELGLQVAGTNAEAAGSADVVVLAVPFVDSAGEVADEIRASVMGKPVIDATNPIKPDYSGLATDGTSGAEELQQLLPDATVIKAFNTIFAGNQASPSAEIDGYVAGADGAGKQLVMGLVEAMGFTAVDVGPLSAARQLEGMAWLNIGLNTANGWGWTSAWRLQGKG